MRYLGDTYQILHECSPYFFHLQRNKMLSVKNEFESLSAAFHTVQNKEQVWEDRDKWTRHRMHREVFNDTRMSADKRRPQKKKTFSQWVKRKESETTNRLFNPDLPVPPSFDILIWIKRSWIVRFDNFEKMYCIWRLKESHGRDARLLD